MQCHLINNYYTCDTTEKPINRNRPRNNRDDEIGGQELYNIYYKYCKYVQNLKENISTMKIAGRYKIMKCLETEKKILRHFMQMETAKTRGSNTHIRQNRI